MSNINYNRQFMQIDFEVLDDPKFLDFVSTAEFGTYLVLRRYVWRGGEKKPHFMGLHKLYEEDKKLVCSISNKFVAEKLGLNDITRVSKHLSKLENSGVIKRIRTGRQNIYMLGEWFDYSENKDGSRRMEWFYLEQKFGISRSDLAQKAKSDLHTETDQTWPFEPNNNIEENRKENTVNGSIKKLKNLDQPEEKTEYVADQILEQLGDKHSKKFYKLVAAKVPEDVIRKALAEIKHDGARDPRKVFTYRMNLFALNQKKKSIGAPPER